MKDNYSFFLFSQLVLLKGFVNTTTEYDVMYDSLYHLYEEFLESPYNVDTKSEYNCIVEFIESLNTSIRDVESVMAFANLLYNNHVHNGGVLEYKEYEGLGDLLTEVEVGCLRDESSDGDYADKLRDFGYSLSLKDAKYLLTVRINSILEDLKIK